MGKEGFTLVELVVTITVLSLLAGIAVPSMAGYRDRAAAGVNEVNLLTTKRQIMAVRQAFPGEFAEIPLNEEMEAEEDNFFRFAGLDITAPRSLEVKTGENAVGKDVTMKTVLETDEVRTYYAGEGGEGDITGPAESVPEIPEEPTEAPTIPQHPCLDRDENCRCDTCGAEMHEEARFVDDGNCKNCGIHFIHRGLEDEVCDTCWWDIAVGKAHICSFEEGICRCKCGSSRCDHGETGTDACVFCGNQNYFHRCENCDG